MTKETKDNLKKEFNEIMQELDKDTTKVRVKLTRINYFDKSKKDIISVDVPEMLNLKQYKEFVAKENELFKCNDFIFLDKETVTETFQVPTPALLQLRIGKSE